MEKKWKVKEKMDRLCEEYMKEEGVNRRDV